MGRIVLTEVGPFAGDTYETVRYRTCDWCEQSACEDIWAGKQHESEWRRFYEVMGECGLVCCEHCLPDLLAEDAAGGGAAAAV